MGILGFGKKEKKEFETKTEKVSAVKKVAKKTVAVVPVKKDESKKSEHSTLIFKDVIIRPMITEKAHSLAETYNTFAFEVSGDANKNEIAKYIKTKYKVEPVKIAIVKIPRKQVFSRGKVGFKKGGKKAYVYLKKGDKIELV
jgi:large subunit ribosomal protein L23